ncbi:MAG: HTTM domain-containing protein [Pirellulaceae bacterium]
MTNPPNRSRSPFWRMKAAELFGIDPRSLALFRIAAALILFYDQCLRLSDLEFFYTAASVAPVELVRGQMLWHWSLHFLDGSPLFQTALFALAMAFSFTLLVGYRTWLSTLFCWLLLASVQARVPLVGNGGDLLLRVMLIWGLFVPLGRCWSVDAWMRAKRGAGGSPVGGMQTSSSLRPVVSIGTLAMLLQLCFMYFFTGVYKWNADWLGADWTGGEALEWAMHFDYFALPPARLLAQFPELLKWLSLGTVLLELLGPLVVFIPWQTGKIRMATIIAFASLHGVIQLTLTVGIFSVASMMGWLLFLPPGFWNHRFTQRALRCIGAALPVSAADEAATADAIRHTADWRRIGAIAGQAICAVLLIFALLYNTTPLAKEAMTAAPSRRPWLQWLVLPQAALRCVESATLTQGWIMFRYSPKADGWYVARATLANGEVVDLLRQGRPAVDDKPATPSACFPNQHQRYYFHYLQDDAYAKFRQPAAEFLYRQWNAAHDADEQITRLELQWFGELVESGDRLNGFHERRLAVVSSPTAEVHDDLDRLLQGLQDDEF